jgi:hypothetical protein
MAASQTQPARHPALSTMIRASGLTITADSPLPVAAMPMARPRRATNHLGISAATINLPVPILPRPPTTPNSSRNSNWLSTQ